MRNEKPDIVPRTFQFALRVVQLCTQLIEASGVQRTFGYQLLRSGTAIGSIVEEAQAAHDRSDFAHRMTHALKEARQTNYWLRLLLECEVLPKPVVQPLLDESTEIMKILGAITATTYRSMS
jgi:four helix bundle protein